jgi:hypothetical protein
MSNDFDEPLIAQAIVKIYLGCVLIRYLSDTR